MDFSLVLAATEAEPSTLMYVLGVLWVILKVAIGLGFVIFVHELGHFLVAKACGVKCEKFYVGFDFFELKLGPIKIPRALCKFQWGETEYGIGILPLGGYVKMLGQDDDPRNAEKEAERTKAGSDEARASEIASGKAAEGLVSGQSVEAGTQTALASQGAPPSGAKPVKNSAGETIYLDPRSYPAKSVPARMAIISAGVIMNLIFGVILAAIAYRLGVPESPAVIGGTAPGSPAWEANIQPGSKLIQIGSSPKTYEHLRYEDLIREVMFNGTERKLPMTFRRPDGSIHRVELQPTSRLKPLTKRPSIGVVQQFGGELGKPTRESEYLAAKTSQPLLAGDKIVAIEGQRVEADHEISEMLLRRPSGPLNITVERKEETKPGQPEPEKPVIKEIDVVVEQRPVRGIGAIMKIGPVVAIRKDSPAERAGFQLGDIITAVSGEPVGDPLSLPQRPAILNAQDSIEFTVERHEAGKERTTKTLVVTPELALQFHDRYTAGGPAAIDSIGVAYNVSREIAEVTPGSPAAAAGMKPGDIVTEIQVVLADEERKEEMKALLGKKFFDPTPLDDDLKAWTYVFSAIQGMPPEAKLRLTWKRGAKFQHADLTPVESQTHFDESRGLPLMPNSVVHTAGDWPSAFALGGRELFERLKEVLRVLQSLITGNISPTNLAGPMGIMSMAGESASMGIPMLLIFLTVLSANLAVLNFLPIPALDGGHMLFLAAEGIRGRPVDERLQIRLTIAGVLCLLGLMVFATLMDLNRFLS